jgi:spore maturation protein SpmA
MLILSITYIFVLLGTGKIYQLNGVINGEQNDAVVVSELDSSIYSGSGIIDSARQYGAAGYLFHDTAYLLSKTGTIQLTSGKQRADGLFQTCKKTLTDIWLPLIAYLTFFCGLLHLLHESGAIGKLAKLLSPLFTKIFPELPPGHPAYGFMTLNFAANFLGLDNAATPFGLKAMESMQDSNPDKNKATNSQIMFLCLHAAGLTLIPTSIIGYRAAQNAMNPADIMIPCIITSFVGTLAALIFVSIKQRINLLNLPVILFVFTVVIIMGSLLYFIQQLHGVEKIYFTGNLSNAMLLLIILLIIVYSFIKEKVFKAAQTNIFESFITGAKEGWTTGLRVLPYMIAMLAALSIFRNSGLMDIIMQGFSSALAGLGVDKEITDAIPVALMRPFSAGGSRGFMLDAMKTYGPDSLTGHLACLFQGAAETTFYVIALYFGSVNVKETRYTLSIMLLVDLVCVLSGIIICKIYF